MQYDRRSKQAIKNLDLPARAMFEVIEREEKGEIVGVEGLCSVLVSNPQFIVFSCLSGDGKREELGVDLGVLFSTRLREKMERFMSLLQGAGFTGKLLVIVDDTEPVRFWRWSKSQEEITLWCQMVREDSSMPSGWEVVLWSELEKAYAETLDSIQSYTDFCRSGLEEGSSVVYHKLLEHIRRFPNKGLKDISPREAALHKLAQYSFQRLVFRRMIPNAVLIQTETPWAVKDLLLYSSGENSFASIIHPFEERRR